MKIGNVSILIVTRNRAQKLDECLKRISLQSKDIIDFEVIVGDGSSNDNTKFVTETYGFKYIDLGSPDNPELRRYTILNHAKNNIVGYIDDDNFIPYDDKNWIYKMSKPFFDNHEDLIGSFTKWYGYDESSSPLDIYYSLIGGNDPIAIMLGKYDRAGLNKENLPNNSKLILKKENYDLVNIDVLNSPPLGCNGFFIKKDLIVSLDIDPSEYMHPDINISIMKKIKSYKYAVVRCKIIHDTGENIIKSVKKRFNYFLQFTIAPPSKRIYKTFDFNIKSISKLIYIVVVNITIFIPAIISIFMIIKSKKIEWIYHPIICFFMTISYIFGALFYFIKKN